MVRAAPYGQAVAFSLVLAALAAPLHAQGYPTSGDSIGETARSRTAETVRRFRALAPGLVQSAAIKPGDLVSISGGPTLVPEMEALGEEVQKAGGYPLLVLDSPRLTRQFYTEFSEQYLEKIPTGWDTFQGEQVDVAFVLPAGEDFATIRRTDPERRARVDQALSRSDAATLAQRNKGKTRTLIVSIPTPSDTASIHMDYRQYEAMSWSAIEADYQEMAAKGQQIKRVLEGAKRLRITSPEGTDFTVDLGKRPVVVRAGIAPPGTKGTIAARTSSLPGGSVRFAPVETSANGKIRAAEDQCEQPIRDESIDVRKGMPENVRAGSDEQCLQRSMKDAGRFGSIIIGLNPAIQFTNVPSYSPQLENAAGMVSIAFGGNGGL
ncbi:MAG TPA: aminopeptidase, partial [Gemmatimonadales bacterium]